MIEQAPRGRQRRPYFVVVEDSSWGCAKLASSLASPPPRGVAGRERLARNEDFAYLWRSNSEVQ